MTLSRSTRVRTGLLLVCLLLVAGCQGSSYTYQPDRELKPGPGLLSGEDGEFNLVSPKNDADHSDDEAADSQ